MHACTRADAPATSSNCEYARIHFFLHGLTIPHLRYTSGLLIKSERMHEVKTNILDARFTFLKAIEGMIQHDNNSPVPFLTFPPSFIPTTAADRMGGGCGPPNPENRPFAESDTFTADTFPRGSPAVNSKGCAIPGQLQRRGKARQKKKERCKLTVEATLASLQDATCQAAANRHTTN